jgi:hypothetical protein
MIPVELLVSGGRFGLAAEADNGLDLNHWFQNVPAIFASCISRPSVARRRAVIRQPENRRVFLKSCWPFRDAELLQLTPAATIL